MLDSVQVQKGVCRTECKDYPGKVQRTLEIHTSSSTWNSSSRT